jgi:hypothetical protein
MKLILVVVSILLFGCKTSTKQVFIQHTSAFKELLLPAPNAIRTGSGAPGVDYWQQRVDHDIHVSLDTSTNTILGSQSIQYTNNSPDALSYIWLHLEQNIHRDDSIRSRGGRGTNEDGITGITISTLSVDGEQVTWHDYATLAKVDLHEPLKPHQSLKMIVDWSFPMPTESRLRMGFDDAYEAGAVWELAQWIPVPVVYDDVYGWNTRPYIGNGEFYTNFGDYKVSITVPRDHIVVASGSLVNPRDVLTREQQERLEQAMESDEVIAIVSKEEVGSPESRPEGEEALTWKFEGDNIRTFAWATSASFILEAASVEIIDLDGSTRRVLCQAAYPVEKLKYWDEAVTYVQHSVKYYSDMLYPYPWPQMTVVCGAAGGMEYPMLIFCRGSSHEGLFNVTDHEIAHNWFPMIVNNDERMYAWMDEGFNTFVNHYSLEDFYGDKDHKPDVPKYDAAKFKNQRIAMNTPPDLLQSRRHLSYRKPGYGMRFLREEIVGGERFDAAFRTYVHRWAFKSPRPADFYRSMEDAAGMDLQWFFRGFIEESRQLDQGIADVHQKQVDEHWKVTVSIDNHADWVCPVDLRITCIDESVHAFKLPVTIWAWSNNHSQSFTLPSPTTSVQIDPRGAYPDIDRSNNDVFNILH